MGLNINGNVAAKQTTALVDEQYMATVTHFVGVARGRVEIDVHGSADRFVRRGELSEGGFK